MCLLWQHTAISGKSHECSAFTNSWPNAAPDFPVAYRSAYFLRPCAEALAYNLHLMIESSLLLTLTSAQANEQGRHHICHNNSLQ